MLRVGRQKEVCQEKVARRAAEPMLFRRHGLLSLSFVALKALQHGMGAGYLR